MILAACIHQYYYHHPGSTAKLEIYAPAEVQSQILYKGKPRNLTESAEFTVSSLGPDNGFGPSLVVCVGEGFSPFYFPCIAFMGMLTT